MAPCDIRLPPCVRCGTSSRTVESCQNQRHYRPAHIEHTDSYFHGCKREGLTGKLKTPGYANREKYSTVDIEKVEAKEISCYCQGATTFV